MTRGKFTIKLARLLDDMYTNGEEPVLHEVVRTAEQQFAYYKIGRKQNEQGEWEIAGDIVTKCDGYVKKSAHQSGLAADIYLADENGNIKWNWDKKTAEYWHMVWQVTYAGAPMISWDAPHFQAGEE